ncbi:MAG: hypothetical protein O2958_12755 [Gemmatimonadetes bacterium]|nr:hypothetical protein [Gemmatimonadota bacterium]MDA1103191.1 hypothetical protein [Gemmatimonadota bacterium]
MRVQLNECSATGVLEPINLPEAFRVDGLVVNYDADPRPDLASICQIGQLIELTRIFQ